MAIEEAVAVDEVHQEEAVEHQEDVVVPEEQRVAQRPLL